ncbi:hypothetical protein Tco_0202112 [Tanacetum coccineum]
MFHNLDQFRLQFERDHFHEVNAKNCLEVLRTQFKEFFASKGVTSSDYLNRLNQENFKDYTGSEPETYRIKAIKETKKLMNEAIPHEHEIQKSFKVQSKDVQINLVQMQMQEEKVDIGKALDVGLVVTESSGTKSDKQDTSSISGNDTTHAVDADIRPGNDQEPLAEVNSNTTTDSTNMSNYVGKTDHNAEQYHVKSPLPASLIDQPTTDQSYQSLEAENIFLKKTIA